MKWRLSNTPTISDMPDALDRNRRSENMRRITSVNTKPEMIVRRIVHGMGYRYRLHGKDLPGRPDLVFRRTKKVIFVHGCFWHQHQACREGRIPGSRQEYWIPKLARNVQRDTEHSTALVQDGWKQLVVWECEMRDDSSLRKRLREFLESPAAG